MLTRQQGELRHMKDAMHPWANTITWSGLLEELAAPALPAPRLFPQGACSTAAGTPSPGEHRNVKRTCTRTARAVSSADASAHAVYSL